MFRFTIRDVLWAVAVVAFAVGWWAEHRVAQQYRDCGWNLKSLTNLIEERGYAVNIDGTGVYLDSRHDYIRGTWRSRDGHDSKHYPMGNSD